MTPAPNAAESPATRWYRRILALAPNRKDVTIFELIKYAQRAAALSDDERRDTLASLAACALGDVACAACGSHEVTSNEHHRFYRVQFTCRTCGHVTKTV